MIHGKGLDCVNFMVYAARMKNGPYELVIAPDDYPGKRYRGRYCYEHHLVWWRAGKSLPAQDEVVHHKNNNKRDNRLENLKITKRGIHSCRHTKSRGRVLVRFRCPSCGVEFIRPKWKSQISKGGKITFCSRQCTGKFGFSGACREKIDTAIRTNVLEIFRSYDSQDINDPR
jgi:predicted RNA-binding Zn-ribbon protein involved in translation (DUF1610 family)